MGGLTSAASYLAAMTAVAAGSFVGARANRSNRSVVRRYLAAALITIGVTTAVLSPLTVSLATDWNTPPNIVRFIGDLLGVAASFCVLAMVTHAYYRPEAANRLVRRELAGMAVTGLVMVTLLLLSATPSAIRLTAAIGINPFAGGYELLYVASAAVGMANFLWLIHCQVRHGDHRLRPVLWMNATAAVLGVAWVAWKVTALAATRAGAHLPVDQDTVSELLATVLVTLIALGCIAPVWSVRLARCADHARARRAVARLTPLWTTLTTAVPDVALDTDGREGPEYALYRRVIEIRDAQMTLRAFAPPDISARARAAARRHGLRPGRHTALVVEAAELASALRTYRAADIHPAVPVSAGGPARANCTAGQAAHASAAQPHSGPAASVRAEARWLISLSHTLASNPIVAELIHDDSDGTLVGGGHR